MPLAPRSRACSLGAASLLLLVFAAGAQAQVVVTGDCMWPVGCGYTGTSSVPVPIVSPVGIRNLDFIDLLPCTPTPASGTYTIDSFFDVFFDITLDGGATWTPKVAPATGRTQQVPTTPPGSNPRLFDTEMLLLDLHGGTLPPGVRMRESPSRLSPGHETLEDLGGGSFRVTSFFDVFFELSVDNGVTWSPASNTYHVTLTRNPPTTVRAATWGALKAIYR